jgi:hypothetical protein
MARNADHSERLALVSDIFAWLKRNLQITRLNIA